MRFISPSRVSPRQSSHSTRELQAQVPSVGPSFGLEVLQTIVSTGGVFHVHAVRYHLSVCELDIHSLVTFITVTFDSDHAISSEAGACRPRLVSAVRTDWRYWMPYHHDLLKNSRWIREMDTTSEFGFFLPELILVR